MSVLKASSALALYCNVFGHVPLFNLGMPIYLISAFKASSNCSIIFSSESASLYSGVFGSNFFCDPVILIFG